MQLAPSAQMARQLQQAQKEPKVRQRMIPKGQFKADIKRSLRFATGTAVIGALIVGLGAGMIQADQNAPASNSQSGTTYTATNRSEAMSQIASTPAVQNAAINTVMQNPSLLMALMH